jgi:hypothetical protein
VQIENDNQKGIECKKPQEHNLLVRHHYARYPHRFGPENIWEAEENYPGSEMDEKCDSFCFHGYKIMEFKPYQG